MFEILETPLYDDDLLKLMKAKRSKEAEVEAKRSNAQEYFNEHMDTGIEVNQSYAKARLETAAARR